MPLEVGSLKEAHPSAPANRSWSARTSQSVTSVYSGFGPGIAIFGANRPRTIFLILLAVLASGYAFGYSFPAQSGTLTPDVRIRPIRDAPHKLGEFGAGLGIIGLIPQRMRSRAALEPSINELDQQVSLQGRRCLKPRKLVFKPPDMLDEHGFRAFERREKEEGKRLVNDGALMNALFRAETLEFLAVEIRYANIYSLERTHVGKSRSAPNCIK